MLSELTVRTRTGAAAEEPLLLDGDELAPKSISIDGVRLADEAFEATPQGLVIKDLPGNPGFRLSIETEISPAGNKALSGLYLSNGVYCTQCEAEGFRRITYFLDRPDILSTYTVRIEADRAANPLLLSNGNLVEQGGLEGGRHYAVWHDPHPKPSYLFALVAGDLGALRDSFTTASGREVALAVFVEHGKEKRAAYAMDSLKRAMRWDEERFGREYDLDVFNIVAVSDFNMGAMENKGLNLFNDKYILADEETATDADFASIEAIVAHEYFHNWTGNRITCRDWFQLCLKEGLTVYRDHEFSADMRSRPVKRIAEVRALMAHQFPEDQGPLAHPVRPRRYREINNFYTATVYEKGSEIVRMIRTILGEELFRKGMDLYFERHDGDAATIEDFVKVFEDVSGRDLSQFSLWYHQAGTPNVGASASFDAKAGTLALALEQSVPPTPAEARKRLMHIPLAFGLVGPDGKDMAFESVEGASVQDGVIHLRKRSQTVTFTGLKRRPVISLNRGFSAPVTLSLEQKRADRLFLARNDGDLYCRWQALNGLLMETLIDAQRRIRGGKPPSLPEDLVSLPGALVCDDGLETAFRAQMLTLPGEADVAREIGANIDPDAIFGAVNALRKAWGKANMTAFQDLYRKLDSAEPFRPDAAGAGRRALRNALLAYVSMATGDPDIAFDQFRTATNMSERASALTILAHQFPESGRAREALARFAEQYGGNPLVMDKWFVIQATIPGKDAVERVRRLMGHPTFGIDNPNRVRSLVGAFASANQTGFHRPDGAGYGLLAETVLRIDRGNPQLAARIATAMRSWRSMEPVRQDAARAALADMSKAAGLSTDLRDIVERTLA